MNCNLWQFLEEIVFNFNIKSEDNFYNIYDKPNVEIDLLKACEIRKNNLGNYINSLDDPPVLLVGEAPGVHGMRRSGVPFTSESQLLAKNEDKLLFSGTQSTKGKAKGEQTATIFWNILKKHHDNFFVWNCIPFHPHEPGKPLENRTPKRTEIRSYIWVLEKIIDILSPELIVAIGNKAKYGLGCLENNKIPLEHVRHPSFGGKKKFEEEIIELLQGY